MKKIIKILLLYIMCTGANCEPEESEICHTAIWFSNNSPNDVYVRGFNGVKNDPRSTWIGYYRSTSQSQYKVGSGEQNNRRAADYDMCIEHVFRREENSDTLKFYILDAVVVENTPWEVVARDYLVLKRYDLTLEDLQRLDWKITYPPTYAMKDIKQYPPYGNE